MLQEANVSRIQLALNVRDIDEAVDFYERLFHTPPAKRRPGYANFAVVDPPLKLVLIETGAARSHGIDAALNHLGIEVASPEEVVEATAALTGAGLSTVSEEGTECCYALQDKVWVDDPDGAPWEVYTVLADAPDARPGSAPRGEANACCAPASSVALTLGRTPSAP